MADFINKTIGVLLAFVLLVGAPLILNTMSKDLTMKRGILNEMTNLINKVTDSGKMTEQDVADFYLAVSSYGVTMDATIQRYIKVVNPDGAGGIYTSYVLSDDLSTWNKGDIIKVTVRAVDYTGAQRIQYRFLRFTPNKFEETLAGMVRR